MSTFEYNDLYLKCQESGKYHMFVFDIVNSKKMSNQGRWNVQNKMIKLMTRIYKTIEKIQESTNRKILVFDEDLVTFKNCKPIRGIGFKQEPFLFADTFGFTIYRDSLDKEVIYYIYEYFKKSLDINFDFHITDGYYETNYYAEGNKKYFRGYCMDILSTLHKENTQKELKKLKKKLKIN